MFENILNKKYNYEQRFRQAHAQIERDKVNNEKIDQYKQDLNTMLEISNRASEYLDCLKIVDTAVTKEARDYQTRRIEHLNSVITESIARIFPNRRVRAKLIADFSRTDKVSLKLFDDMGNEFSPYICEGKLMQYLISVSAVAGIIKSLGATNMFIDEAFGVARIDHLEDLGEMLQSFVDDGLQTVIISQNPALYNNLSRHEIWLTTMDDPNGGESYACVEKEVDI